MQYTQIIYKYFGHVFIYYIQLKATYLPNSWRKNFENFQPAWSLCCLRHKKSWHHDFVCPHNSALLSFEQESSTLAPATMIQILTVRYQWSFAKIFIGGSKGKPGTHAPSQSNFFHFYRPQRSWGKVIFSEACVKNSAHTQGGGWGVWSRGGWSPGPHPGGKLRGLAGGSPGPHLGHLQAHTWEVYPSMHWGRHPPSRRLLLRAVRILLECILVHVGCVTSAAVAISGGCLPGGVSVQGGVHLPLWTDRHLWKHKLSATTVADGNKWPLGFMCFEW